MRAILAAQFVYDIVEVESDSGGLLSLTLSSVKSTEERGLVNKIYFDKPFPISFSKTLNGESLGSLIPSTGK